MNDPVRTLVIPVKGDQVLLGRKKQHRDGAFGVGKWNGFGGKQEPGETIEQTAIRECEEESGIRPTKLEKVAELDFTEDYDLYGHIFLATDWDGEVSETDEMIPQWFNIADLPYDLMWDDDIFWLPAVLRGKKLKAKFKFANKLDTDGTKTNPTQSVEMVMVDRF